MSRKGLLPPNPNQWANEHRGLDLRELLVLAPDVVLEPEAAFQLLPRTHVLPHGQLEGCDPAVIAHFRGPAARNWSGAAFQTPDGAHCVLYNDAHPRTRIRATLMEEYFHLSLGHPTSTIRFLSGEPPRRTFNAGVEAEAYGSGAAALVPYKTLREWHNAGRDESAIGAALGVSPALVEFRLKVTRLWRRRKT